jgi:hypothetical protein
MTAEQQSAGQKKNGPRRGISPALAVSYVILFEINLTRNLRVYQTPQEPLKPTVPFPSSTRTGTFLTPPENFSISSRLAGSAKTSR